MGETKAGREMTLREWVYRLTPTHRARREYEALNAPASPAPISGPLPAVPLEPMRVEVPASPAPEIPSHIASASTGRLVEQMHQIADGSGELDLDDRVVLRAAADRLHALYYGEEAWEVVTHEAPDVLAAPAAGTRAQGRLAWDQIAAALEDVLQNGEPTEREERAADSAGEKGDLYFLEPATLRSAVEVVVERLVESAAIRAAAKETGNV
jgi:hypothetical protein